MIIYCAKYIHSVSDKTSMSTHVCYIFVINTILHVNFIGEPKKLKNLTKQTTTRKTKSQTNSRNKYNSEVTGNAQNTI